MAFAWLWADSDSQINARISRRESQVSALRSRLMATSSEAEIRRLLASSDNVSRLQASLRAERSAMLRNSLAGTLRVFFGALIISSLLALIRSQS